MPDRPLSRYLNLSQICAALVLCACQSTPKHASTVETLGRAGTYLVCLHNAAITLDDRVSDVSRIAPAVADRCRDAFDKGLDALAQGMSPLEAAIFRHKAERENLKLAAAAVHEERQEKSGELR